MLMLDSEELRKANPYINYPIHVSQPTGDPVKIMYKTKRSKSRAKFGYRRPSYHKGYKRMAESLKRQMKAKNSSVTTTIDCTDDDEQ
jgi:hypothetical protein